MYLNLTKNDTKWIKSIFMTVADNVAEMSTGYFHYLCQLIV